MTPLTVDEINLERFLAEIMFEPAIRKRKYIYQIPAGRIEYDYELLRSQSKQVDIARGPFVDTITLVKQ